MEAPRVIIIAGPNGAGKTTFAREFLPKDVGIERFINADLIAMGLSPFRPEAAAVQAGRLMLAEIDTAVSEQASFAIETTLAGKLYARRIEAWHEAGYRVKLVFLKLASVDLAIARVAERVAAGGHDIPQDVIRRRWRAGLLNFENIYRGLVDSWAIYENSGSSPILLEEGSSL